MKLGSLKKAMTRGKDGANGEKMPDVVVPSDAKAENASSTAMSRITSFTFKVAARKSVGSEKELSRKSAKGKNLKSPLFRQLPEALQEQSIDQDHLWEYLHTLPIEEIGVPAYHPRLSRNMDLGNRNLIYPLGKGVFVHLYPDTSDSRDYYIAIEPSMNPALTAKMEQVDKHLINYVDELKKASDGEERTEVLLQCLHRICHVNGGRGKSGTVPVTEKELQGPQGEDPA